MKSRDASAETTVPCARVAGVRLAWLAVAGLVGILALLGRNASPGQELLLANPLALLLFAAVYILIRMREASGRF